MSQMSMFTAQPDTREDRWRAPEVLPVLDSRFKRVWSDTETTGLNVYKDKPVGYSFCLEDGRKFYLPWGHAGGGNLDEAVVKRWVQTELRDKDLVFTSAKYDNHMFWNWGIDLEAQGCRLHDVAFQAALLDERRRRYNLEQMSQDMLGRGKNKDIAAEDKNRISELPASMVGPYAEEDAVLVKDLDQFTMPLIKAEELERVLQLEDSIIYAVCEMERNGAPIDRPKLEQWVAEAQRKYESIIFELYGRVHFRVNPDSPGDMLRLFKYEGLQYPTTEEGNPSFEATFLEKVQNENVQLALRARRVASLLSKYLKKYLKALGPDNILRYSLHQLRSTEENYGAVSGRFSCAAPSVGGGANLQQVLRVADQRRDLGDEWIIRELFVPASDKLFTASDAAQIEFRLFAHYANSPRLNQAYQENPYVDFHDRVQQMVEALIPGFPRQSAKTLNFTKVYGGGRDKVAITLKIPRSQSDKFVDAYDEEFPEASKLLRQATDLANNRGYVKTYLGRRARFKKPSSRDPEARRIEEMQFKPHSALNRVLQGTAADVMKLKIKEVYDARKELQLTLRFVVHDELDGDLPPDPTYALRLEEILNVQSLPFRIPLLWEVGTGLNWKDAKK